MLSVQKLVLHLCFCWRVMSGWAVAPSSLLSICVVYLEVLCRVWSGRLNEVGKRNRGEQQRKREGETEMGEICVYGMEKQSPGVGSKKNKFRSEASTGFWNTDWWAWIWSEHYLWKLSIRKCFLNAKNCFPKVTLTGMRLPLRKMKAFCLKAFLFSMKLIKKKAQSKIKSWNPGMSR